MSRVLTVLGYLTVGYVMLHVWILFIRWAAQACMPVGFCR